MPSLRAKIKNAFMLGPVATVGHIRGFLHYLANYLHTIEVLYIQSSTFLFFGQATH